MKNELLGQKMKLKGQKNETIRKESYIIRTKNGIKI